MLNLQIKCGELISLTYGVLFLEHGIEIPLYTTVSFLISIYQLSNLFLKYFIVTLVNSMCICVHMIFLALESVLFEISIAISTLFYQYHRGLSFSVPLPLIDVFMFKVHLLQTISSWGFIIIIVIHTDSFCLFWQIQTIHI